MSDQIIDLQDWLETPPGRYLLDWEQAQVGGAVADIFGYHALQLGLPTLAGLQHNRMPHRWLATQRMPDSSSEGSEREIPLALVADFSALPFPSASLDLVVLPHTLEFDDAHAILREAERVLVAEGRVLISGFNPLSLWAFRLARQRLLRTFGLGRFMRADYLPIPGAFLGVWRLRDWLRLLGFEVELVRYGCYAPAVDRAVWLQRFAWLEPLGARWWPMFGAAYVLVAVKKVRGTRLLGATWKAAPVRAGAAVVAGQRRRDMVKEDADK